MTTDTTQEVIAPQNADMEAEPQAKETPVAEQPTIQPAEADTQAETPKVAKPKYYSAKGYTITANMKPETKATKVSAYLDELKQAKADGYTGVRNGKNNMGIGLPIDTEIENTTKALSNYHRQAVNNKPTPKPKAVAPDKTIDPAKLTAELKAINGKIFTQDGKKRSKISPQDQARYDELIAQRDEYNNQADAERKQRYADNKDKSLQELKSRGLKIGDTINYRGINGDETAKIVLSDDGRIARDVGGNDITVLGLPDTINKTSTARIEYNPSWSDTHKRAEGTRYKEIRADVEEYAKSIGVNIRWSDEGWDISGTEQQISDMQEYIKKDRANKNAGFYKSGETVPEWQTLTKERQKLVRQYDKATGEQARVLGEKIREMQKRIDELKYPTAKAPKETTKQEQIKKRLAEIDNIIDEIPDSKREEIDRLFRESVGLQRELEALTSPKPQAVADIDTQIFEQKDKQSLATQSDTKAVVDQFKQVRKAGKLFGLTVKIEPLPGSIKAIYRRSDHSVVYNSKLIGTINPMETFGHEFTHWLNDDGQELYKQLRKWVNPTRTQINAVKKKYHDYAMTRPESERATIELNDEQAIEEIIADKVGADGFANGKFWETLKKSNPSVFDKVMQAINEWVATIKDKLGIEEYDKFKATLPKVIREAIGTADANAIKIDEVERYSLWKEILNEKGEITNKVNDKKQVEEVYDYLVEKIRKETPELEMSLSAVNNAPWGSSGYISLSLLKGKRFISVLTIRVSGHDTGMLRQMSEEQVFNKIDADYLVSKIKATYDDFMETWDTPTSSQIKLQQEQEAKAKLIEKERNELLASVEASKQKIETVLLSGNRQDILDEFILANNKTGKVGNKARKEFAEKWGISHRVLKEYLSMAESLSADKNISDANAIKIDEVERYSLLQDKNLVTIHNIPADSIEKVKNRGGMVMPSIAIIDAEKTKFTGFGDVSLLGTEKLVNVSAKNPLYSSDAWTPTYPRIRYVAHIDAQMNALIKYLNSKTDGKIHWSTLAENIKEDGLQNGVSQIIRFHSDLNGEQSDKLAKKAIKDYPVTVEERLFAGFDRNGNARLIPHTAENALAIMRKHEKEGKTSFWGTSSLRGALAQRFSTLASAKKSRDKILSKEQMQDIENETENMFMQVADRAKSLRKRTEFMYMADIASDIYDMSKKGWRDIAELYINDEIRDDFNKIINHMINLPTQYFEYKPQRVVQLNEFMGAVIPKDTKASTIKAIKDGGLKVYKYETNNDNDRYEQTKKASEELGIRYSLAEQSTPEAELSAVRTQYENTPQWMTAPNGKPTNLNERQWLQVRTPSFKRWFGDWENDPKNASKVVDENGEPMVVYHGYQNLKNKEFTVFEIPENGAFFTNDKEVSKTYVGNLKNSVIYEVFLNIKAPVTFDVENGYWSDLSKAKLTYENNQKSSFTFEKIYSFRDAYTNRLAAIVRKNKLIDGMVLQNIHDIGPRITTSKQMKPSTVYIVTESTQIKSATANIGTFDPNNADIRYSLLPNNTAGIEYINNLLAQIQRSREQKSDDTAVTVHTKRIQHELIQDDERNNITHSVKHNADQARMVAELLEDMPLVRQILRGEKSLEDVNPELLEGSFVTGVGNWLKNNADSPIADDLVEELWNSKLNDAITESAQNVQAMSQSALLSPQKLLQGLVKNVKKRITNNKGRVKAVATTIKTDAQTEIKKVIKTITPETKAKDRQALLDYLKKQKEARQQAIPEMTGVKYSITKTIDNLISEIEDGKVDIEDIMLMPPKARHNFFKAYVSEQQATKVNAFFEEKLLLKHQYLGLKNWVERQGGLKERAKTNMLDRIAKNEKLYNPIDTEFYEDLAATRLGMTVNKMEAVTLYKLAQRVTLLKEQMDTNDTEANRNEYGIWTTIFWKYYHQLKEGALKKTAREYIQPHNWGNVIMDVMGTVKSGFSWGDQSQQFRQLVDIIKKDPVLWGQSWAKAAELTYKKLANINLTVPINDKVSISLDALDMIHAAIASHPLYDQMAKGKLAIHTIEESYPTEILEKLPVLGRLYEASQDTFSGVIHWVRAMEFAKLYHIAKNAGVDMTNVANLKALASQVNNLTGRGELANAGRFWNAMIFSIGLAHSRINSLTGNMLNKQMTRMWNEQDIDKPDKYFFKEKGKDWIRGLVAVGAATATVYLMVLAMGGDPDDFVELDPRSSDFLKVRYKNTRIDAFTGGAASYIVLLTRSFLFVLNQLKLTDIDEIKNSTTGVTRRLNRKENNYVTTYLDILTTWGKGKMSPLPSTAMQVLQGENYEGRKPRVKMESLLYFTPLMIQNTYDAMKDPESAGLLGAFPDFVGMGTNSYSAGSDWGSKLSGEPNETQEMTAFKQHLDKKGIKFEKVNRDQMAEFDRWIIRTRNTAAYIKLGNEDKQKLLTKKRKEIKSMYFRKYGYRG
jgi:hypothetical protein